MTITPQQKKLVSGLLVGLAVSVSSAALAELVRDLPALVHALPAYLQIAAASLATGAVTGIAHIVDAWGHSDRVDQAVTKARADAASFPAG